MIRIKARSVGQTKDHRDMAANAIIVAVTAAGLGNEMVSCNITDAGVEVLVSSADAGSAVIRAVRASPQFVGTHTAEVL